MFAVEAGSAMQATAAHHLHRLSDANVSSSGRLFALPCPAASSCRQISVPAVSQPSWSTRRPTRWSTVQLRRVGQHVAVAGAELSDLISSQDEFTEAVVAKPVVVVDWMAKWCRKCIYLKPKLAKMLNEEFPGLPIHFIDVNAVPGNLVYDQGIKKMPTITIYKDGQKVREHIAAEGGLKAIAAIRDMVKTFVEEDGSS